MADKDRDVTPPQRRDRDDAESGEPVQLEETPKGRKPGNQPGSGAQPTGQEPLPK